MTASKPSLPRFLLLRVPFLVLAALGLAGALLLHRALSSDARRGDAGRELPPAEATALETAWFELEAPDPAPPAREPAAAVVRGAELESRVRSATEELVRSLDEPLFDQSLWRRGVEEQAGGLGPAALPWLQEILSDGERSPEEHVAASELVAALRPR